MTTALINLDQPAGLPAHLQGFTSTAGTNMTVGGAMFNRIGLKGSRFRLIVAGQEELIVEDNYLDVIIVGASPKVSRMYYEGVYIAGEKKPPTCYSSDGVPPNADVAVKQSTKCQTCPQNVIGSRVSPEGKKGRACGYFKRLVTVLPSDPSKLFRLETKGMTIFSDGQPKANKFSLADYAAKLKNRGVDPSNLITRLSFNTDESVPVVVFTPLRYLEPDEAPIIADVVNSEEVQNYLEITAQTVDLSGESGDTSEINPPAAAQAAPQAPPVQAAAPVAAPPPVAAPVAAPAPAVIKSPAPVAGAPVVTRVAAPVTVATAPVVRTVVAAPVVKATPPRIASVPPAVAVAVPTHAPAAAAVETQDQSDDAGLAALIQRLGE